MIQSRRGIAVIYSESWKTCPGHRANPLQSSTRVCQCSSNLAFVNRKKYLGQWLPRSVRVHQSVLLRKDGGEKGRQEAPFTLGSLHQDLCSKHLSITNGFPDEVEKMEWCWHSRRSEKKTDKPEHQSREIMKIMIPATLTQRLLFGFYAFPSLPAPPPHSLAFSSKVLFLWGMGSFLELKSYMVYGSPYLELLF